jgi:hypothetical protein
MAVINYSPKQGVLGTRQQPSMTLAEIAAKLSGQENALSTRAIGGVLGLVNQAREYDYPDTALGWASLPAKAVTGVAKGMMDVPGKMIDDAYNQVAGLSDGRAVTEGALGLLTMSPLATAPAGAIRMFAGRNAKTADLDALAQAEKMIAEGRPRSQVWNDTGWFKDVDGNMKFEIDDSGASLNTTAFKDGMSGDKFLFDKPLGEARNVQTRMDYTPTQRRATPPWSTLDVPEDELIVRRK